MSGKNGKKRPRGRPFSKGDDARRNRSGPGKKTKTKPTPAQVALDAIMAPQSVKQGGKQRKAPKLRVVFDQQLILAMQADQSGARTLATLLRAVTGLGSEQLPENAPTTHVHDLKQLNALLDDYVRKAADAPMPDPASDAADGASDE